MPADALLAPDPVVDVETSDAPGESAVQEAVCNEIDAISAEHGGRFEARDVVEYARSRPNSELHRQLAFHKSDAEVADTWRIHRARQLISLRRFVRQLADDRAAPPERVPPMAVRKYVHVMGSTGYLRREDVLDDPGARARFAEYAKGELRSWCARYADVPELDRIRAQIAKHAK